MKRRKRQKKKTIALKSFTQHEEGEEPGDSELEDIALFFKKNTRGT